MPSNATFVTFASPDSNADHSSPIAIGSLAMRLPTAGRTLRVIGFDDAPFPRPARLRGAAPTARAHVQVPLVGVVCAGTRFEGLVLGRVVRDGWRANEEIVRLLRDGKFLPQLHMVLLDGIAFGGFNVVDLPALAAELQRPCVAVMRKHPDLPAVERAMEKLPNAKRRIARLRRAGEIHGAKPFVFQVQGADPEEIARVLPTLADRGHVPEALRLAHVIGTAIVTGESGRRA